MYHTPKTQALQTGCHMNQNKNLCITRVTSLLPELQLPQLISLELKPDAHCANNYSED